MVGLDNLKSLFQPKKFYDSMNKWTLEATLDFGGFIAYKYITSQHTNL